MDKILDVATRVSTPIAVAGLVVGVLLILFYAILRLKVFPRLNRTMGHQLLDSMMKYLYRLALVSIVLGFVAYLTPIVLGAIFPPHPLPKESAKLPIRFDFTLRQAIRGAAQSDERTVKFENCSDALLNAKVRKAVYQGRNYADIIDQLQHNLDEPAPQPLPGRKDFYSVQVNQGGYYEVICNN